MARQRQAGAYGWKLWAALVAVAAGAGFYFIFNPEETAFMPRCVYKMLTGWSCPGCGSQRALHSLLHMRLEEAWGYNALLVALLPAIGVLLAAELLRKRHPRFYVKTHHPAVAVGFAVLIVGWTVARNVLGI